MVLPHEKKAKNILLPNKHLFLLTSIKCPESRRNYENILEQAAALWTYKVAVLPGFFHKEFFIQEFSDTLTTQRTLGTTEH